MYGLQSQIAWKLSWWNFLTENKFSAKKCSCGLKTQKKNKNWGGGGGFSLLSGGGGGFWGAPRPHPGVARVGKRYTSSYDHDMWPVKILERSGLAVKSYHPETLAAEEEKKK